MKQAWIAGIAAAAAVGACSTGGEPQEPATALADRDARAAIQREDLLTQMTFWAREAAAHPDDVEAARAFAETLRVGGRVERAATVSREALQRFGEDQQLLRTYGLASLALGNPGDALRPLARVAQLSEGDHRALSALGVALDHLGRVDQARQAYQEALALRPDDVVTLTNLGVSYLMAGEPAQAETILRQAAALPGAPPETRQNLAIALALQGQIEEAEQLARVDLPPAMAAANIAYLRGLFQDPRSWGDLRETLRR